LPFLRSSLRAFALVLTCSMLTTAFIVLSGSTPADAAVSGSGAFPNAAIADKALTYYNGKHTPAEGAASGSRACADARAAGYTADSGGQCRAFVNCIVYMVGHLSVGGDYYGGFLAAGGKEITATNDLVKGDIVQYPAAHLHTTIIVSKVSDGNYMVVDSNHFGGTTETVDNYSRPITLGNGVRAFRMGKVGPSSADYVGSIVQWDGDRKPQKTSWLVEPDGRRYWISDVAQYWCWRHLSAGDKGPQPSSTLDGVIPDSGRTAACPSLAGPSAKDTLRAGQSLMTDMSISSMDGRYRLIFQGDRNLVLYGPGGAVWATNRYTGDFVIMQGDGNLVAYNIWSAPAWDSHTGGIGGNPALVVQNDGNLVIYAGGRAIWDRHRGRLV
jgi:hypothetical protein